MFKLFKKKKTKWIRVVWRCPDGSLNGGLWAKATPKQRKYFAEGINAHMKEFNWKQWIVETTTKPLAIGSGVD
jgi:hypothetical protein